uniref:Myosin XVIIIB n=1 Tax=Scleropages formosus TaxID=113540 RepID=A0A8C9W259_SCLFO
EGTPELPAGKVRVRLETDGSLHDVMEYEIEEVNPPELDLVEDLSELVSMNESGVLHTLCSRARAQLPLTRAGPNLLALWPPPASPSKGSRSPRGEGAWEAPSVLQALVRRTYVAMVSQRRDQSVLALGRSGTGKTSVCTTFAQELLRHAGLSCVTTAERLQAVFAVLRSFGCVSSPHSDASSRFAMLLSLDFNHAGLVAGGHLQVLLCPPGARRLTCAAALSVETVTQLHLHQQSEPNSFGIVPLAKVDERQKASAAFAKLLSAMETLGFSANEQQAIWHVLAGIYHLGAAGSCKVGRRQFLSFDNAQLASSVLGCEGEELQTAVFKHHLRQLLLKATGGSRERHASEGPEEGGPRLSAKQCVEGMAMGLYEELFAAVVSLINRSLCSHQLTLASVTVVDAPGLRSPRHCGAERAAGFAELAHNYLQERLLEHCYTHTFTRTLERYKVPVDFRAPESSAAPVVSAIDQPASLPFPVCAQLRAAEGDARGLLWVLDEETMTPGSTESAVLDRVCRYFGDTGAFPEQGHAPLMRTEREGLGRDLTDAAVLVQNNPSALNAAALLQNSTIGAVKSLFGPRASLPPLCRGIGGVEGGSQRSLQRSGIVRKTFSGGLAAVRRQSYCISVKLQAVRLWAHVDTHTHTHKPDLSIYSSPSTTDGGKFDVPSVRAQLSSTHLLSALQLYRTGYPDHMSLSDFRCRFQALSPPVMKRYGSVFITPDDRKAVEELLVDLDLDKKSIVVGTSRVFMKRGVLRFLEQERDRLVSGWMVLLQASCLGHLARQKYRCMKVQHMAVSCIQRNVRVLSAASTWSWWKLFCRVRPMLNVNIDDQRFRAKEDEIAALRQRLEKSEKDRNELRQTVDHLETKVTALSSELCDERFRGEAVSQALDVERAERLRLAKESKELLSELQLQLECAQTEVEFLRRRLRQSEERLDQEREARAQLDSKVDLEQSKRTVTELKRQCRRLTSDLQDARVLTDNLQSRAHELDRKQRRYSAFFRFARSPLTSSTRSLQRSEVLLRRRTGHLQQFTGGVPVPWCSCADSAAPPLHAELAHRHTDAARRGHADGNAPTDRTPGSVTSQMHLRCEMEMERMKQIHQKELEDKDEELEDVQKSSQRRLRQLEMQLEQEYEEKQRVVHEKHDLEGLIATLCEQVGHRDFDVEKRLRRDLKRTRALLSDAQLLLSTADTLEESEARRVEAENVKKMLAMELENAQLELESICKHKSLVDEQLAQLLHEKMDLLKRLEEDQEDLNELMKKHKALIAQSSSDISQIQELQTELEEAKKEKQRLEDECVARLQHLESSTVSRSIVSKQEARVCDLENKLEFQRGQIKRFEVLVLRLRDSVVRLGEELEQAAQAEARERENARYYQQRLADLRLEMEDLIQQEQESGRRRLELEMQVEELSAVRQTLQADLDTSMRRIADLQAALEEMDSGGESDGERWGFICVRVLLPRLTLKPFSRISMNSKETEICLTHHPPPPRPVLSHFPLSSSVQCPDSSAVQDHKERTVRIANRLLPRCSFLS